MVDRIKKMPHLTPFQMYTKTRDQDTCYNQYRMHQGRETSNYPRVIAVLIFGSQFQATSRPRYTKYYYAMLFIKNVFKGKRPACMDAPRHTWRYLLK